MSEVTDSTEQTMKEEQKHSISTYMSFADNGAEIPVYLASSPEIEGVTGKYFVNKKVKKSTDKTYDTNLQKILWNLNSRLTHLKVGEQ